MARTERAFHGIDIGGSKIELVAFIERDGQLQERHRQRVRTPATDFEAFLTAIAELVATADSVLGAQAAVGIGLPGITDGASGRQLSSNVPALNGRCVSAALAERLARPVVIGNDCQCFALSEAQGGAAHGLPSMFGAIIGTGAGGGYCVDGRLVRGQHGLAGEFGHWSVPAHLLEKYRLPVRDCPCGLRGCLERYIAGPGLSHLHSTVDAIPPLAIVAKAAAGDAVAEQALATHVDLLAYALSAVVTAYDPHVIVLGGGLSNLTHLYQQLPQAMRAHLLPGVQAPPILAPVFGDAGGARGAALLARQQEKGSAPFEGGRPHSSLGENA